MMEDKKQALVDSILNSLHKDELDLEALEVIDSSLKEKQPEKVEIPERPKKLSQLEYQYIKKNLGVREVPFKDSTELGETFNNLDNPTLIDFNSRLAEPEIAAILVFDELQNFGVFPKEAKLTTTFKRLKVSQDGKGRSEKRDIVTGQRKTNTAGSFFDLFKRKDKEASDEPTK